MSNRDDHWSSGADGVFDACGLIRLCNAGSCAENEQIVRWHNRVVAERDAAIARVEKAERDAIKWEGEYQLAAVRSHEEQARADRLAAYVRADDALRHRRAQQVYCDGHYLTHECESAVAQARAAVDAADDLGGAA